MLHFLVLCCAGMLAAVSCHPRTPRASVVAPSDVENYIEVPLEQKVRYHYQYGVADAASGVFSHKWEERLGSYVKGAYSMMEADGRIRTVDYEVDGPKGFHAVVRTSLPGNSYLSTQQLRKSRDSNPQPPVNVLTNNIPSKPVLEPRTPRLVHKDLPPNFHSVKPDYFWGSAPGGHAAKHRHTQDGDRRGRNGGDNAVTRSRSRATFGSQDSAGDVAFGTTGSRENDEGRYAHGTNVQGRAQNAQFRFQQENVQSYNHNSDFRGGGRDSFVNSRQAKGRRQEGEEGNFVGGVDDDLSSDMLPPKKNAEVMNYDHLLRAGKITDVLYL